MSITSILEQSVNSGNSGEKSRLDTEREKEIALASAFLPAKDFAVVACALENLYKKALTIEVKVILHSELKVKGCPGKCKGR